jgi:23S rRNA (guanosine2251-2'-O)-methyltransferase
VTEALRAGGAVQRISVAKDATGLPKELFEMAREQAIPVVRTDKDRLDYLSRGGNHQGVVAQLGARSLLTFQQWLEQVEAEAGNFLLALDQVQDPQNLGALLRSADGAGCRHVLLSAERSCGLTSTVSKTSAGADQHLVIGRTPKMGVALEQLRERGFQVVATSPRAEKLYHEIDFRQPTVLLLGGEERGLPPHLRRAASQVVKLPMQGRVESLNVASSGAILLYEVVRQRQMP